MFFGYNTNGFAHHRLEDAVRLLAELGYGGIAITLDYHALGEEDHPDFGRQLEAVQRTLEANKLRCVIETGARFLLDVRRKHQPTLLSPDPEERATRSKFLHFAAWLARQLSADAVSFWSGTSLSVENSDELMARLVLECQQLADASPDVRFAFEPEPGMFIDTMEAFAELHAAVQRPNFGLTLDVGHLVCLEETPVRPHILRWKDWLWNIHIEDMRRGVHDHVMFGEGEVDFADVFAALREANYQHGVYVELSRHSHDAINTAKRSRSFLERW